MNRIKELRLKKGLTLKELGKQIGLRDSTLSQYETGKVTPRFEYASKIADFFNVSLDFLLNNKRKSNNEFESLLVKIVNEQKSEAINKFSKIYDELGIEYINLIFDICKFMENMNVSEAINISRFANLCNKVDDKNIALILKLMEQLSNNENKK